MIWQNSDRYDGDWKNGMQSGHGVFVSSGGEAYNGDWQMGRKHGSGEEYGPWGHYSGQFRNGNWHGKGQADCQ
ncbi:MAG: hypothetical protein GY789_26495 [Hyphomicrobiales bacterium]|nr:hypothetical protein [Hyphomicrobiales bacterium]MCP5000471.1 hypothetical protein [Hyphomicrobiales bacterium]